MTAVVQGDARAVRELLAEGGDIDIRGALGRRALLHAAAVGDQQMVRTLLRFGADPNARAKDKAARTALVLAAAGGRTGVVEVLLANGAEPEARDSSGSDAPGS